MKVAGVGKWRWRRRKRPRSGDWGGQKKDGERGRDEEIGVDRAVRVVGGERAAWS